MTSDEVLTALRCCASDNCNGCPSHNRGLIATSCISRTMREAADLIEFQQQGLEALTKMDEGLVVLPCKVGDGLWTFCSHPVEQVYSFTVTHISTLNGRTMLNTSRCGVIDARDVGKTVFLTREEAEKALEGMTC